MSHALSGLKPSAVWNYFYQLTQIPRPSKHEDAIQAFMLEFGTSLNLETFRDEIGNIIIRKPATIGMEHRKGIILQSHLDMVPQANNDTEHDFTTDPINAFVDGDWVTARGTTLGADNGMGVAAIMAVLADTEIQHGPLEALFTCDEETGMTGAINLQPNVLNGDILLNLDSEDEKELYIGCAGGIDGTFSIPLQRQPSSTNANAVITIKGLRGGHSGMDIIQQRGNANVLLARFLCSLNDHITFGLVDICGGNLRNAIPREAEATVAIDAQDIAELSSRAQAFENILRSEYTGVDDHIILSVTPSSESNQPLTRSSQTLLLNTINSCPHGVYRMSLNVPGLVETSNNFAIVRTEAETAYIGCLLRSSSDSARDDLAAKMKSLFDIAGGSTEFSGAYPGWQPNTDSEILQVMKETGKQLFGNEPKQFAIHAGLECGILGGTYPHWDMISFGPTIRAPHSPDEKVHIASVSSFYHWLVTTLAAVPPKKV